MTINVLGEKIKVKYKPIKDQGLRGYYDNEKKEIIICTTLSKYDQIQTIIHELSHAALIRIHLGNIISPDAHETIVDVIATAITENFELKWKKRSK